MGRINVIIFFICLLCPITTLGQNDTSIAKAYRNVMDFKKDRPLFETSFKYYQKTATKYHGSFKVKSAGIRVKKKEINFSIWIISDGDYLFVNGARLGLQKGYIKLNKGGKYYHFIAEPLLSVKQQEKLSNSAFLFGAVGAAVTSAKISKENRSKMNQVLNLERGTINILTKEYVQRILVNHPKLLVEFNTNANNSEIAELVRYLEIVNKTK